MGNNCDRYEPLPEPEFRASNLVECSPHPTAELTAGHVNPEPNGGPLYEMDDECVGSMELMNYTFDGCLKLELDMEKLCLALDIHAYLFGSLFLILVITAFVAFVQLLRNGRKGKNFLLTINVMMIALGVFRTLFLFIDAYGLKGKFRNVGALLFQDLAVPCLTTAFALVQWAFFELVQVKRMSFALQNSRVLVAIVICHFVLVAAIDFLLFFVGEGTCFLMTVCQAVNVAWGLTLTLGFCYVTQKLLKRDKEHRLTLKRSNHGRYRSKAPARDSQKNKQPDIAVISGQNLNSDVTKSETISETSANRGDREEMGGLTKSPLGRLRTTLRSKLSRRAAMRKSYLTKVKNVGIYTTLIGLSWVALSLYGLIAVYNPFDNAPAPSDWGWYAYQTLQRSLELCFGFILIYLSMSPGKQR